MNERYDFASIESKWQTKWAEEKTYAVTEDKTKPQYLMPILPGPLFQYLLGLKKKQQAMNWAFSQ